MRRNPISEEMLECRLTDQERIAAGEELSHLNMKKRRIDNEKKAVMSQFKAQLDECEAQIALVAQKVSTGMESRRVKCICRYNDPEEGIKTTYRTDTNEKIRMSPMTQDELEDLFINGMGLQSSDENENDLIFVFANKKSVPVVNRDSEEFSSQDWLNAAGPLPGRDMIHHSPADVKNYRIVRGYQGDTEVFLLQRRKAAPAGPDVTDANVQRNELPVVPQIVDIESKAVTEEKAAKAPESTGKHLCAICARSIADCNGSVKYGERDNVIACDKFADRNFVPSIEEVIKDKKLVKSEVEKYLEQSGENWVDIYSKVLEDVDGWVSMIKAKLYPSAEKESKPQNASISPPETAPTPEPPTAPRCPVVHPKYPKLRCKLTAGHEGQHKLDICGTKNPKGGNGVCTRAPGHEGRHVYNDLSIS